MAFISTNSQNSVLRLHNPFDIVQHWKFLESAMVALNDSRRSRAGYTPEKFFNTLTRVASQGEHGLVCLLQNAKGLNLGFGCGFSACDFDFDHCFYVWQAYSSGQCKTTLSELLAFTERHAKTLGHEKIKIATRRMNHGADRLFQDVLGFKREFYLYRKSL